MILFLVVPLSDSGREAMANRFGNLGLSFGAWRDMPDIIGEVCGIPYAGEPIDLPATGDCDERGVCRCGCGMMSGDAMLSLVSRALLGRLGLYGELATLRR